VNRAIDDRPDIQQEAICYQWFKQRLILSVCKPATLKSIDYNVAMTFILNNNNNNN